MKYKPYQAPFYSFFSSSFYKCVIKEWTGLAFLYLFTLVFSLCTIVGIQLQFSIIDFYQNKLQIVTSQLPDFKINNGILTCKEEMPCIVKSAKGRHLVMIDTRENAIFPDDIKIRITKTKIYSIDENGDESNAIKFTSLANFDRKSFFMWLEVLKWALAPLSILLNTIIFFALAVLQVFINAIIGLAFSKVISNNISFATLVKLASVAITPAAIILTGLLIFNADMSALIFLGINLVYLFFGVMSTASKI